jgi:hypothetical protein
VKRSGLGGGLLTVAAVALLLPLVALASRPDGAGGPVQVSVEAVRLLVDTVTYLLVAGALAAVLVIVWALWPRPDDEAVALPPRRRRSLPMTMLATALLVLAVWLRARYGHSLLPGAALGGLGLPSLSVQHSPGPAPRGAQPRPGIDWPALGVVLGVVLASGAGLWWLLRGPRRRPRAALLAGLAAVLDDAIEDVLREHDPRRAVVAAWARLERVMSRHGLPRRAPEAPLEYASRAQGELGIEVVSLQRLAELYEWARYSLNEVTPAMRQEALDGLVAVRDGLSAAA